LRSGITARTEVLAWPTEAWVELAGTGQRHVIGRAMLRIGREADNDICLSEKTVHRYHAVIRRTTDGEVVVTDLSGAEGNGVLINGARVGEGRLTKGDLIGIGEVKLRFDARPV
jgi:pSer/pThr/pTyr-binding forkhead associated (FHA) protein